MNMTIQKWGGLASFLLAVAFFIAPGLYLTGNVRDARGVFAYQLADFLSGPVACASLVTVIFVLRERIGKLAPRRMDLALLASVLAAAGLAAVAFIRASNRHHHLIHPELNLEHSTTVLTIWRTLVAGMSGLGFHFLGWTFLLVGSAGWTSGLIPRPLSVLYLITGTISLFVYLSPDADWNVMLLGVIISVWQGILLWIGKPEEMSTPNMNASQPGQA